jgi:hypothetical protein
MKVNRVNKTIIKSKNRFKKSKKNKITTKRKNNKRQYKMNITRTQIGTGIEPKVQQKVNHTKTYKTAKKSSNDRLYKRTVRTSMDKCFLNNLCSSNEMFNTLFQSSSIYEKIIQSAPQEHMYYSEYNVSPKRIEHRQGAHILRQSAPNGRYLVRLTSEKVEGHAICVIKTDNECTVYDSNDSCSGQYGFWATNLFVSNLECDNIVSGYGSRTNSPMVFNICTMFAIYMWIIGEVPHNKYKHNKINNKKNIQYTINLLEELEQKFIELNLPELSDNMRKILNMEIKFT